MATEIKIKETWTKKIWSFKKVDSLRDVPRSARRYHDLWTVENNKNELYELFISPAGVIYGFKK